MAASYAGLRSPQAASWGAAGNEIHTSAPPAVRLLACGVASVGLGDGADDRQSEANAAAGSGRVLAGEAVERAGQELRVKAGAAVAEMDLDRHRPLPRAQRDRPRSVVQRVVEEVRQRLMDPLGVGRDDRPLRNRLDVDRPGPSRVFNGGGQPRLELGEQLLDGEWLGIDRQCAVLRSGEQQQVFGESGDAIGLLDRRA